MHSIVFYRMNYHLVLIVTKEYKFGVQRMPKQQLGHADMKRYKFHACRHWTTV